MSGPPLSFSAGLDLSVSGGSLIGTNWTFDPRGWYKSGDLVIAADGVFYRCVVDVTEQSLGFFGSDNPHPSADIYDEANDTGHWEQLTIPASSGGGGGNVSFNDNLLTLIGSNGTEYTFDPTTTGTAATTNLTFSNLDLTQNEDGSYTLGPVENPEAATGTITVSGQYHHQNAQAARSATVTASDGTVTHWFFNEPTPTDHNVEPVAIVSGAVQQFADDTDVTFQIRVMNNGGITTVVDPDMDLSGLMVYQDNAVLPVTLVLRDVNGNVVPDLSSRNVTEIDISVTYNSQTVFPEDQGLTVTGVVSIVSHLESIGLNEDHNVAMDFPMAARIDDIVFTLSDGTDEITINGTTGNTMDVTLSIAGGTFLANGEPPLMITQAFGDGTSTNLGINTVDAVAGSTSVTYEVQNVDLSKGSTLTYTIPAGSTLAIKSDENDTADADITHTVEAITDTTLVAVVDPTLEYSVLTGGEIVQLPEWDGSTSPSGDYWLEPGAYSFDILKLGNSITLDLASVENQAGTYEISVNGGVSSPLWSGETATSIATSGLTLPESEFVSGTEPYTGFLDSFGWQDVDNININYNPTFDPTSPAGDFDIPLQVNWFKYLWVNPDVSSIDSESETLAQDYWDLLFPLTPLASTALFSNPGFNNNRRNEIGPLTLDNSGEAGLNFQNSPYGITFSAPVGSGDMTFNFYYASLSNDISNLSISIVENGQVASRHFQTPVVSHVSYGDVNLVAPNHNWSNADSDHAIDNVDYEIRSASFTLAEGRTVRLFFHF